MRVFLRISLLLICLGILIGALLPPDVLSGSGNEKDPAESAGDPSPTPEDTPEPNTAKDSVVRDMLGGVAIDAGKKAKDVIGEANDIRQQQIDELDGP